MAADSSPRASTLAAFGALHVLTEEQRVALAPRVKIERRAAGTRELLAPGLWGLLGGRARLLTSGGQVELRAGTLWGVESLWRHDLAMPLLHGIEATEWLHLAAADYQLLRVEQPGLALSLLHALLESATARDGTTLERALSLRTSVSVVVSGQSRQVRTGTRYAELLPERAGGLPVVAALVDHKATSLSTPVTSGGRVEPLTARDWEGQRIYRHSLALLALEAAHRVRPGPAVRMGPSVGFGRRVLVQGHTGAQLDQLARNVEAQMNELITDDLQLSEEHWAVDEARDYFADHGWSESAQLLGTWRGRSVPVASYGDVYVLNVSPVLPHTAMLDGFFFLHDQDVLLLVYGARSRKSLVRPSESMPPHALTVVGETTPDSAPQSTRGLLLGQARANHDVEHEEQAWLKALGVTSIGAFNQACISGSVPELIRVAEGFQEKRLTVIADEIHRRETEIDIVCIAGPSSSGKTTFIQRLCVQLQVNGIQPVALGLDDYYVDRVSTPRDATGDYDFEALEALQLGLLHEHLASLLAGETVTSARYAFDEGKSYPTGGREIRLGKRDVLLVEGIHALNPALLGDVPARRVFRIFVCPLMQLAFDHLSRVHASDVRLIRRIVRDRHSRGYDAAQTIERWPKVRAGERQHIYPFQLNADAVFDASLVYELSVLRVYAERYLLEVPRTHPSYKTAFRLMHMLDGFVSIYPDHVPPTSILREFIGGSGFEN